MISHGSKILSFDAIQGVRLPQLKQPELSLNPNGGYLYILDSANGKHTEQYQLYLNGKKDIILTTIIIKMQEYGISETDEIGVVCKASNFLDSPMSTIKWSDLETRGTIGLAYSGNRWIGLGTATAQEIHVASIVNGVTITTIPQSMNLGNDKIIYLPDSITSIAYSMWVSDKNLTVVFGSCAGLVFGNHISLESNNSIADFRNALYIPEIGINFRFSKIIIPDNLYEEWIHSGNWTQVSRDRLIRASVWEAQQG